VDLLASALAPSVLRVGGTQADYDVYTGFGEGSSDCDSLKPPMTSYRCRTVSPVQWAALLNFTARNGLQLVYGLSDLFGRPTKTKPEVPLCGSSGCPPRDQSNLRALLSWTVSTRPVGWDAILGFELGNELNDCLDGSAGAKAQAEDLLALKALLSFIWSNATATSAGGHQGGHTPAGGEQSEGTRGL
jgi:hypothetical protein